MSAPKDVSSEVPAEVALVMSHLKPEPEALAEEREQLLADLETVMATTQGTLLQLLEQMRAVLLSTKPGVPFQPRFAREFTVILERYRKDPDAPKPPPEILIDCLIFMRELVEARGLGPLLAAVDEVSLDPSTPEAKARQQKDLQTRIKLGNTRG